MNLKNFQIVLQKIEREPDSWNQSVWHCGSRHCFAGWCELFLTGRESLGLTPKNACLFLGIVQNEHSKTYMHWLFERERTLDDFRRVAIIYGHCELARAAATHAGPSTDHGPTD